MRKNELMVIVYKALDQAMDSCSVDNPLEAWTIFIDRLDAAGRRCIGDQLQSEGKNRYTGDAENERTLY
ncbi:MAG TPA: hypothetical protein DEP23_05275 [Ruminococcaceae bacterium]|jgi:hypothetical protein|nr:hypothetical protein [Oscillospiraceae bacterium]